MRQLLIALVVSIGLAFAPLAEAFCQDPDCTVELTKVEKKETQAKALHVCSCHHHSTSGYQLPLANLSSPTIEQQAVLPALYQQLESAAILPLLEPPSHA